MLRQAEADSLIAMPKSFVRTTAVSLPPGSVQTHDLVGSDGREEFLFDLSRGTIRLSRIKLQTRARAVIILARLEIEGPPHTNPDGNTIVGTHLHVYREGYDDKWAYPLDPLQFSAPGEIAKTFSDFCSFCNIAPIPSFQQGL
jgi:hypothetical protein